MTFVVGSLLIGAGISAAVGGVAASKANKAKKDGLTLAQNITDLENARTPIINPYDNVEDLSGEFSNPFANLGVASKSAEMKIEQADISLANTLDAMKAGGFGGGGATALAMAAAKSKQGVVADIEQQEASNEKLRADGEQQLQSKIMAEKQRVQNAEVSGAQFVYAQQDARDMQQLNRAQAMYDNNTAQQMAYQSQAMSAFTGAATGLTAGLGRME
jgi:hypothetical protein